MSREEMVVALLSLARGVNQNVRGKYELQPREEARRKLFTTDRTKPGELVELIQVLERWGERFEVADELADVVYYGCQLGAEEWLPKFRTVAELLGFTEEELLQFGLVKYRERVRTGRKDKKAEGALVRVHVETIPLRQTNFKVAIAELRRILREAK